jgi:ATP-dependent DNA helicase PIF1
VRPFAHCIGCGWELIKDNKYKPQKHQCENRYCKEDSFDDIDKWAFRSKAWEVSCHIWSALICLTGCYLRQECNFKHINLTQIHRQSDKMFISILNKIRTGEYTPLAR